MIAVTSTGGHSAQVKIQLLIEGGAFPVAQLGPDFLLLPYPVDHPPAAGVLVLQVDQRERRWNVHLPDGMVSSSNRVSVVRV